jgi:CRISPR-associated DxTHG motif protein
MSSKIILTMLGTGDYKETDYTLGNKNHRTSLVPVAVKTWFPEYIVKVLVTPEAKQKHWATLESAIPNSQLLPIQIQDPWSIYQAITDNIPENSSLILDITHGFRSLPMISMLTVSFLRAAKNVKLEYLLYGAYEYKETTEITDLTELITMLDWANATNRFLETGDARKFENLLESKFASPLKNAAGELRKFSEAMALHRTEEASETAQRVFKDLQEAKTAVKTQKQQPFLLLEERIINAIHPIANENIIFSQFAQIEWYTRQRQHAQAIALAREWMVSVRIWVTDKWFSVSNQERELAENWLTSFSKLLEYKSDEEKLAQDEATKEQFFQKKLKKIPPQWQSFIILWGKLAYQRNDYAHFGMRPNKISSGKTLNKAITLLDDLRKAVAPLGLELPEVSQ